jgi:hypothetical protein
LVAGLPQGRVKRLAQDEIANTVWITSQDSHQV